MAGSWLQLDAFRRHLPVHLALASRRAEHVLREAHLSDAGRASHLRCKNFTHRTNGGTVCKVNIFFLSPSPNLVAFTGVSTARLNSMIRRLFYFCYIVEEN